MKAEQMWKLYAERHQIDAPYEAWTFCGGGEVGDQLARLVLEGKKTATASALIAYQTVAEKMVSIHIHKVI